MAWMQEARSYSGDDCVLWPFKRNGAGYGQVWINGKGEIASRVMCALVHGDPPTPQHEAAHSCGRGHDACVTPGHLRWATTKENMADRVLHGTANRGSKHGLSKLSEGDIADIRQRLLAGESQASIAKLFPISQTAVSRINRGETWGWL